MYTFPELSSQRLLLNELVDSDADGVFAILSDPEVVKHYDLDVLSHKKQAADLINSDRQRFLNGDLMRWAVREKSTGLLIGSCGIGRWDPDSHHGILGYEFGQQAWGKGYATEAVSQAVSHIFSDDFALPVNRIQADTQAT